MLSVELIKVLSNKEKYKLNKYDLLFLDLPAFYGQYGCCAKDLFHICIYLSYKSPIRFVILVFLKKKYPILHPTKTKLNFSIEMYGKLLLFLNWGAYGPGNFLPQQGTDTPLCWN